MTKLDIDKSLNELFEVEVDTHPCFSEKASLTFGRIHLPIAPKCNVSCNFCNRKFDCVSESRPGVTSKVITPERALARLEFFLKHQEELTVVGIAGPGDPLANPEETLKTIQLVHSAHPELSLCISTNGLMLEKYLPNLIASGLSHLTITVNSFKPEIVEQIYSYIIFDRGLYNGLEAAEILIEKQKSALAALEKYDIPVKINIVLIPGINDDDIPDLVDELRNYSCVSWVNIMPLIPVEGSVFENMKRPSRELLTTLRNMNEPKIPQIRHCCQCRADAVGKVSCNKIGQSIELIEELEKFEGRAEAVSEKIKSGTKVAVASISGGSVDEHFGHASKFHIYEYTHIGFIKKEQRAIAPFCCSVDAEPVERLSAIIHLLSDCAVIMCTKIGPNVKVALESAGFGVIEADGEIEVELNRLIKTKDS
jgi:nitrogen fixation protein NifB